MYAKQNLTALHFSRAVINLSAYYLDFFIVTNAAPAAATIKAPIAIKLPSPVGGLTGSLLLVAGG